jgi:hypothetical protein
MREAETPRKLKPEPPAKLSPLTLAILAEPAAPQPKTYTRPVVAKLPPTWLPPEKTSRTSNAEKTHCDKGHEFTDENTRMLKSGSGHLFRACIACARIRGREQYRRNREKKAKKAA